jgi:multidrug efflux pump subunit AcrB
LQIALPNGAVAPLSQLATFEFRQESPLIWRRDRTPTLTVQADPATGLTAETAVAAIAPAVAAMNANLPPQYRIETGGTVEESAKSQSSVFARVPLMLFLMITFLMIQLQSFSRLFLVLAIVPMGLIGIIAALLIFGKPLGFVAILGILSLLGMIARNAVILVEQIEIERREQSDQWKAVVDATLSRFRPITLTAISTVLGLIPIAPTVFWGPMAFAIMGGLLVATVLTLVVTPALYVLWFGIKETA